MDVGRVIYVIWVARERSEGRWGRWGMSRGVARDVTPLAGERRVRRQTQGYASQGWKLGGRSDSIPRKLYVFLADRMAGTSPEYIMCFPAPGARILKFLISRVGDRRESERWNGRAKRGFERKATLAMRGTEEEGGYFFIFSLYTTTMPCSVLHHEPDE